MNIFKTFTFKWWQAGIFKLGMLALGIAIGTYWRDVFGAYLLILILSRPEVCRHKRARSLHTGYLA